jgi:hypothetical protein
MAGEEHSRTSTSPEITAWSNVLTAVQSTAICETLVLRRESILQTGVRSRRLSGGWWR